MQPYHIFYALHNSAGSFVYCPILVNSWGFKGLFLHAIRTKIVLLPAKSLQFAVILFSTPSFLHVVLLLKQFRFSSLIFWVMQAVHGLSVWYVFQERFASIPNINFFVLSCPPCHPVNTRPHTKNSSEQADTTLWVLQEHGNVL